MLYPSIILYNVLNNILFLDVSTLLSAFCLSAMVDEELRVLISIPFFFPTLPQLLAFIFYFLLFHWLPFIIESNIYLNSIVDLST